MHYSAQASAISEAAVDKLLGANFLSLALIALVMVVAMFLLFVYMDYRRQQSESRKQDAFLRVFTDDKSPMVTQQSRVGDAIEKMVELQTASEAWHQKHDTSLTTLSADVKSRSELDGQAIEEFRGEMDTRMSSLEDVANTNKSGITDLKAFVEARFDTIDAQLEELMNKRDDCPDLKTEWAAFRSDLLALLESKQPVTNAVAAVILPNADTLPDDGAAKEAAA